MIPQRKEPIYSCVSEVKKPEIILVHKPGEEIRQAIEHVNDWGWDPTLEKYSDGFEKWLKGAQDEHQKMVSVLQSEGINVLYLTDLLKAKKEECKSYLQREYEKVKSKLKEFSEPLQFAIQEAYKQMFDSPVDGILSGLEKGKKFSSFPYEERFEVYKQLKTLMPQTSLLFTQDPVISTPNGLVKARMAMWIRHQEPDIVELALGEENYIHRLRNRIEGGDATMAYLHGGDILYSDSKMLIGISALSGKGIEKELKDLEGKTGINAIKVHVPDFFDPSTAYEGGNVMHLDTLMMPLTEDILLGNKKVLEQTAVRVGEEPIINGVEWINKNYSKLVEVPYEEMGDCGLATNVLPLGNGKVISSTSNPHTNENMRKAGIKVLEIETKALNLGYGSLHCSTAYLK